MRCPKCGAEDCRVSVIKKALQVNIKVTTTKWCRRCWWQDEKTDSMSVDDAAKVGETASTPV